MKFTAAEILYCMLTTESDEINEKNTLPLIYAELLAEISHNITRDQLHRLIAIGGHYIAYSKPLEKIKSEIKIQNN